MNNKLILTAVIFFLVIGLSLKSCNRILDDKEILESKNPNSIELDAFSNIDISVMAADISIKSGDSFALEYKLHPREMTKKAQVEGKTFHFSTDFSVDYEDNWDNYLYDWYIILTIPEDVSFDNVSISTVEGSIMLSNRQVEKGALKTTNGEVWLSNIEAKEIKIDSIAESVEVFSSNIDDLEINTLSDYIQVDGNFDNVRLSTMSADCKFSGNVSNSLGITTVSGNVRLEIQEDASISAKTFKAINYNDMKHNFVFNYTPNRGMFEKNSPQVVINTTSGKIDIRTHEYLEKK